MSSIPIGLFTGKKAQTYPILSNWSTGNSFSVATTIHTITLPTSNVGDLLMILATQAPTGAGGAGFQTPAGWTNMGLGMFSASKLDCQGYWKIADGSEGTSLNLVTTANQANITVEAFRIRGHDHAVAPVVGTVASGTSTLPDAPPNAPSWGSAPTLWIAIAAAYVSTGIDLTSVATFPLTDTHFKQDASTTGGMVICSQKILTGTENPGTWTLPVSAFWMAQTIGIKPMA